VDALVSATSIPERVEGAFSEVQEESCSQQASQSTDRTKRPDLCEVSWSAATAALAQPRTRFTGERRVAKLSKPEERQRSPRMTPLAAAVPGPRRNLFPELGYPSAVAFERVAVYLDTDAGVLRDPHLAVRHADCAAYKVLAEGVR
jgi:hypothetical protein